MLGREGSGVDLAKGQASGEGEVLSEVGGASIRTKNFRYMKKRGIVGWILQSLWSFEGNLKKQLQELLGVK